MSAALAAGNSVIAKPAEQTPLVAAEMVRLLHAAGIPGDVLHLVPGRGSRIGPALTGDPRIAGVAFTGSTETARLINRSLAAHDGPLPVLIAETGGQNAMLVDSSALPEQVVNDAVTSAFNAAGQRCSALRVLFVQEDIAPRVLELLAGVMDTLTIGDPALLSTDVGPVIDEEALATLEAHARAIVAGSPWQHRAGLPSGLARGHYFAPLAVEIDGIARLEREVFGPILHVVRFPGSRLEAVVDEINASGYGLTLGVHTRIDGVARMVAARARVGNVYVNRNMIGAVVGVQPFGGCGLSGTGPKAGGPHYLPRFATEQTVTINTAAVGGNATLLSLGESDEQWTHPFFEPRGGRRAYDHWKGVPVRLRYIIPVCRRAASDIIDWFHGGSKTSSTSTLRIVGISFSLSRTSATSTSPMPQPGAVSVILTATSRVPSSLVVMLQS